MQMRLLVLLVAVVGVALLPGVANAHDLRVDVKQPAETPELLIIEAGFDDDTPAEEGKVTITDANGAVIAEAKTDERGVCKLARPGPGKYFVAVLAFGHRNEVVFEVAAVAGPTVENQSWRPDKTFGLVAGVGGLLVVSTGYWLLRRRK